MLTPLLLFEHGKGVCRDGPKELQPNTTQAKGTLRGEMKGREGLGEEARVGGEGEKPGSRQTGRSNEYRGVR